MRRLAGTLLVTVAFTLPVQSYRYALVVGQNCGGSTVENLHYAENDARRFAGVLQDYAAVQPQSLRLLLHPDSSTVVAAAEKLATEISSSAQPQHSLFFFYFSGHADADGLLLDSTHLAYGTLHRLLSNTPAGIRIAIIDACQSGAIMAFKGGKRAEPFFLASQQKTQGEVWIASSSASERAQESETLGGSLFSFHLFNGLRGSADISNDNKITVAEAYQYAYRKTLESSMLTSGIVQHPMYRFNITGEVDIVLTDLSQKQGGILVDGSCSGTFLIMSRDYTGVYADFHKALQREMFIALPTGDYTIINARGGTDIGLYQFSIAEKKTQRCSSAQFRASLLQESRIKGAIADSLPAGSDNSRREAPFSGGWLFGGGAGVQFSTVPDKRYWRSAMQVSLHGRYCLSEKMLLTFSGSGVPSRKTGFFDAGLEHRFIHVAGYFSAGAGATVAWEYIHGTFSEQVFGAGAVVQGGMVFQLNNGMRMGCMVPWHYTVSRSGITHSIGVVLTAEWVAGIWKNQRVQ